MTAIARRPATAQPAPAGLDDATLRLFTGPDGQVPDWLWLAFEETRKWLTLDYVDPGEYGARGGADDPDELPALSHHTTRSYAADLGLPRALQSWRPPPGKRGRRSPGPAPQSFLRFCASFAVNPFTDVTAEVITTWLRYLRGCGDQRTTEQRRVGALGAWYDRMRAQGHTTIVFRDVLPRQTRRRHKLHLKTPVHPTVPATLEQVRALQIAALLDPGAHAERHRVIAALLPATGLRAEELCGVNDDDLHRRGPGGVPGFYLHGKGGGRDWVEVPRHALALIEAYLPVRVTADARTDLALPGTVSNRPPVAQPLLTSHTGRRLTTTTIRDILRYLATVLDPADARTLVADAARVLAEQPLHPHQFRHFQAQTAEQQGATWTQIGKTLRHRSAETTKIYLESGRDLRNATPSLVEHAIQDGLAPLDTPAVIPREH